jgi:hypothetical protein
MWKSKNSIRWKSQNRFTALENMNHDDDDDDDDDVGQLQRMWKFQP